MTSNGKAGISYRSGLCDLSQGVWQVSACWVQPGGCGLWAMAGKMCVRKCAVNHGWRTTHFTGVVRSRLFGSPLFKKCPCGWWNSSLWWRARDRGPDFSPTGAIWTVLPDPDGAVRADLVPGTLRDTLNNVRDYWAFKKWCAQKTAREMGSNFILHHDNTLCHSFSHSAVSIK